MKKYSLTILLTLGIILVLNFLAGRFFFRFDLTADGQYTLSKATTAILKNLETPITVKAYFSEELPPDYESVKREFREMLVEYASTSTGMVDYEFSDPGQDETLEQEVVQKGVQPILFNVREKDQVTQKKGYMSAIITMGDGQEDIIPVITPGPGMEYALSTGIKKLTVTAKPAIGLIQGHGEPGLSDLGQVYQMLSILYSVENIDLSTAEPIPDRFKTVALLAPKDSIPPAHFARLDDFLSRGGNLFVGINTVQGDFQTAQGTPFSTGVRDWLMGKGLEIEQSFIVDAKCGSVTVQQQQGFFRMNRQVQFPYLPLISNFVEHPITKGLEQVVMPFASPMRYIGNNPAAFTGIAYTSAQSGIVNPPVFFDVINKQWTEADFPVSQLTVGGILQTEQGGRIVAFADGDFPIAGQQGFSSDNASLMVNSIDWLSDDTGLIELRTKGITARPIAELEESERTSIKWINFLLPIALILVYGFFRTQRQRSKRMQRMNDSYA
jgi:gliding-associated putative ABC transporter substrate-binding component GldG